MRQTLRERHVSMSWKTLTEPPSDEVWLEVRIMEIYSQHVPLVPGFLELVDEAAAVHLNGLTGRWSTASFLRDVEERLRLRLADLMAPPGPKRLHLQDLERIHAPWVREQSRGHPLKGWSHRRLRAAVAQGIRHVEGLDGPEGQQRVCFHLECVTGTSRDVTARLMGVSEGRVAELARDLWSGMAGAGISREAMVWLVERLGGRGPDGSDTAEEAGEEAPGAPRRSPAPMGSTRVNRSEG
ncbi:hypothetical protein ABT160_21935 [Streptomyces sp. NPDC001941]|uniref:hypothetical protein n=1 Tax=Streptomyces sp. NPDC001941 TaxID=3154659 RepID=UPI003330E0A8